MDGTNRNGGNCFTDFTEFIIQSQKEEKRRKNYEELLMRGINKLREKSQKESKRAAKNRKTDAKHIFQKAIENGLDYPEAYFYLGMMYFCENKLNIGFNMLNTSRELSRKSLNNKNFEETIDNFLSNFRRKLEEKLGSNLTKTAKLLLNIQDNAKNFYSRQF